jgi:HEAT repeat protein
MQQHTQRLLLGLLPLALASTLSAAVVQKGDASGGTYRGPGDTVPADNGSAGGDPRPAPGNPGPAGPATPSRPTGPELGDLRPGAGPHALPLGAPPMVEPSEPTTPEGRPNVNDPTSWQLWWHYNRWEHIETAGLVRQLEASTPLDGFHLGRGAAPQQNTILAASDAQVRGVALPALLSALREGGGADLVTSSLLALAKLRDVHSSDPTWSFDDAARRYVGSPNQTVSEQAILALGIRGNDAALETLTALLRDEPRGRELVRQGRVGHRARIFAAFALGLLADRTQIPPVRAHAAAALLDVLDGTRPELQAAAVFALGHCRLPADGSPACGLHGSGCVLPTAQDCLDRVLALLKDEDSAELARSQAPTTAARLAANAPEATRRRVMLALRDVGGPRATSSREVRNGAVIALGRMAYSTDVDVLLHLESVAIDGKDRMTRFLSTVALAEAAGRPGPGETPTAGLPRARRVLLHQFARVRGDSLAWTALALGVLGAGAEARGELPSNEVARALRHGLAQARAGEVEAALALALGILGDVEAEELLLERVRQSGDHVTRGYAALALGMIDAPMAVEPLRELLESSASHPFALQQVAISLALLGDREAAGRLFKILESSSDGKLQRSIASSLGWIKDPRPLAPLSRRIEDTGVPASTRAWRSVAVGRICDRDATPWMGRVSAGANYAVVFPSLVDPDFATGLLDLP